MLLPHSDRRYIVEDLVERHDIRGTTTDPQEYRELRNILLSAMRRIDNTLVDSQITSIAEYYSVGVFAVPFVTDGTG
jgi:hypothetical protein